MISYAQNFEDVLLMRALGAVEQGFYIDIGAQHPVHDSVSKAFYDHGWRGIHLEPTPFYAELLRQARPDEMVLQAAVSNQSGTLQFFELPDTGLSTADSAIAAHHQQHGWAVTSMTVAAVTLDDVLALAQERAIHWLKIDVEGFERQALQGWHSAIYPWVVVMESTYPNSSTPTHQEWESILFTKGYTLVHRDGLNRYYLSPEHPELTSAFEAGPNVFDGFTLTETHWAVAEVSQRWHQERNEAHAQLVRATQGAERQIDFARQALNEARTHAQTREAELRAQARTELAALRSRFEQDIEQLRGAQQAQHHAALVREREFAQQLAAAHVQHKQALAELAQTYQTREAELRAQARTELAALRSRFEQDIAQLHNAQQAEHQAALQHEREFTQQLAAAHVQHKQTLAELIQAHQTREAALLEQIDATRQALDDARAQAQVHEAELHAQAQADITQVRADAKVQAQALECHITHLQHQTRTILSALQAQEQYTQALNKRIHAMQSTWWWRFSMSWRRPVKWPALPYPMIPLGLLEDAYAMPAPSPHQPQIEHPAQPASPEGAHPHSPFIHNAFIDFSFTNLEPEAPAMPIQHITELFVFNGHTFVAEAYRNLLGREPDEYGLRYYLGRLAMGYGKAAIIAQLARSPECRPRDEIKGLKQLLAEEKRGNHWLWGLFGRGRRMEKILNTAVEGLQHLESLHGAMLVQAQHIENIARQIGQKQDEPRLADEVVREMFVQILGHEPGNEEDIKAHAKLGTREALREVLLNSAEFQSRIAALPEYARTLLLRQLQAQRGE
ncbi:MAG: FkbM family methyltransferase [Halothiobacillus sp.]